MKKFALRFHMIAIPTMGGFVANMSVSDYARGEITSALIGGLLSLAIFVAAGVISTKNIK